MLASAAPCGMLTGIRVIGILPSVSIAFVVSGDEVVVHRVLYGGQPLDESKPEETD